MSDFGCTTGYGTEKAALEVLVLYFDQAVVRYFVSNDFGDNDYFATITITFVSSDYYRQWSESLGVCEAHKVAHWDRLGIYH